LEVEREQSSQVFRQTSRLLRRLSRCAGYHPNLCIHGQRLWYTPLKKGKSRAKGPSKPNPHIWPPAGTQLRKLCPDRPLSGMLKGLLFEVSLQARLSRLHGLFAFFPVGGAHFAMFFMILQRF